MIRRNQKVKKFPSWRSNMEALENSMGFGFDSPLGQSNIKKSSSR